MVFVANVLGMMNQIVVEVTSVEPVQDAVATSVVVVLDMMAALGQIVVEVASVVSESVVLISVVQVTAVMFVPLHLFGLLVWLFFAWAK